jgi:ATP-dependent Clp protease ATP-binding subunit ClpA
LKRALQKLVIDPLASHLLAGDFQSGDQLEATVEGDAIAFHRSTKGAAA